MGFVLFLFLCQEEIENEGCTELLRNYFNRDCKYIRLKNFLIQIILDNSLSG